MPDEPYSHLDPELVRTLLLRQATIAIDHYLRTWKREDGIKLHLSMELNPDLVERAYGKTE